MKKRKLLLGLSLIGFGLTHAPVALGADITWNVTNGDFLNAANWQGGVPGGDDVALIENGGTATIPNTAGTLSLSSIRLGEAGGSGHVVMNGGTLNIAEENGDPKPIIGNGTVESSFIMNGGAIFLDSPEKGGQSTSFKGNSELDWEVGEKGLGRFEMHGNSQFFVSDDLKGSDSGGGTSVIVIDGNSRVGVGSGISVSGGANSHSMMTIGGNALVEAGNSMGAGNPLGGTDEGYLTMASGGGIGMLTIQDNAVLNFRRLSAREGESTILVKNRGQLNIFDVLTGAGTNAATRPAVTGPNSSFVSAGTGTLTLQDDAQMTVNSDPESGPTKGLDVGGKRDATSPGGKATFTIRDRASFRVEQDLGIGNGANPDLADGTLEIVGPDAKVSIGGNLNLAVDMLGDIAGVDANGDPKAGKATLSEVITGSKHATINVSGAARLAQGGLKVKLSGYTPVAGDSFTLIKGGTISGTFATNDFTEAVLGNGLAWKVEYTADSVLLKVASAPGLPQKPENSGLTPKTATIYVNTPDTINNGKTESIGIGIANNGNILLGWEDDGSEINDLEAVWTMFSPTGQSITPAMQINSTVFTGGPITSKFLSYFRADGSPTPGASSWGPKIKANLFGDGIGMGATSVSLGKEVVELGPIQNNAAGDDAGNFPSVQLLSNSGQPVRIVAGVDDAYAERAGNIRIGDWDYLSNGNILIVGESRQGDDLVDIYGGEGPQNHAIFRIVGPTGTEVKPVTLAAELPEKSEIWHGAGVVSNGFAIRMAIGGRGVIRRFDNAGAPVSTNIDLGTLTGHQINAGGGRGDGIGFHGNGKDAYVLAVSGSDDTGPAVYVSVINADGTLRYSKKVTDDVQIVGPGRVDAAIDETGRVFVAFDAQVQLDDGSGTVVNPKIVMGRLFGPTGTPIGGTFYVSEKELPVAGTPVSAEPRVSMRNGSAAVAWESLSAGSEKGTVALRIFGVGGGTQTGSGATLSIASAAPGSLRLSWTGGTGPFLVQRKSSIGDAQWMNVLTTTENSALVPNDGSVGFFRVRNSSTSNVIPLSVILNGASEAPNPVTTPGVGRGTISLEGNKLAFDIKYSGLTTTANNAHIHGFATTTEATGVMTDLRPFNGGTFGTSGRLAGSVDLTEEQKTRLLAGDTYVNIHTTANGGGEIRGQITPSVLKATLNGAAERPTPVDTPATGTGKFTLVGNDLFVDVSYSGLKGNINNAHIHGPAGPDAATGVLVNMVPLHVGPFGSTTSGQFQGQVSLTPAQLSALVDGLTYFNIHSAVHGGGEIRGQIVP